MFESTIVDVTMTSAEEAFSEAADLIPSLTDYPENTEERIEVQKALFAAVKKCCIVLEKELINDILPEAQANMIGHAFAEIVKQIALDEEE